MNIGFIGLGDMGNAMVEHLIAQGHLPHLWNRNRDKLRKHLDQGAQAAQSLQQLSERCSLIGLCVTSDQAVEALCFGEGGLLAAPQAPARPTVIIDFSTGSPQAAARFAERAARLGVLWVDAPVSGGPMAAGSGQLTIFAGGSHEAYAAAQPLLKLLARNVNHLGPSGSGQMVKLCNQMIVSSNVMAIAEAIALARKTGVDVERFSAALHNGFADSKPLQIFGPRMAAYAFEPRLGALSLMEKDVQLGMAEARRAGAHVPLLTRTAEIFQSAHQHPDVQQEGDLSQAILLFEHQAAQTLPAPTR